MFFDLPASRPFDPQCPRWRLPGRMQACTPSQWAHKPETPFWVSSPSAASLLRVNKSDYTLYTLQNKFCYISTAQMAQTCPNCKQVEAVHHLFFMLMHIRILVGKYLHNCAVMVLLCCISCSACASACSFSFSFISLWSL